ncbi:DNA-processing protein DprA [Romboutsia sedimentorum]|uniref:DNA-processing protein DprA n=1 Tax=Romboutsia sedimentorum TaxID=1368474 RepID=UPI0024DEB4B0|nr:DNA-processing protein DprA [Romboutsia sedimentorum]MDK2584724.1 DNA-processing protein DprA [Romboutsia sedimentorum]
MKNLVLTLSCLPKVGKKTILYFIENMMDNPKDESDLLDMFIEMKSVNKRIVIPTIEQIKESINKSETIIRDSQKLNIKYIDILNNNFPNKLKSIENPPTMLFYKGNYDSLKNDSSIAIVGSRKADLDGLKGAYKLGAIFGIQNYSVVSGLAIGCDEQAHRGCVDVNGNSVAVLPCGLDRTYPSINEKLAYDILKNNGCLVSEYPIGINIFKTNFIERDRIQSGLSSGVIVCESSIKGGTMHTANFAINQKKVLACLDIDCSGNQKLIKENRCMTIKDENDLNAFKLEINKFNKLYKDKNIREYTQQLKLK